MLDCIITHGRIVDGSGGPPYLGDIGIHKGKIACIKPWGSGLAAAQTIDAANQYVSPGFIDMHRHEDAVVFSPGYGEVQLRQGITTIVNGNCGLSIAPCPGARQREIFDFLAPIIGDVESPAPFETFGEYLAAVRATPLPLNFGCCIGNGTVRMAAGVLCGDDPGTVFTSDRGSKAAEVAGLSTLVPDLGRSTFLRGNTGGRAPQPAPAAG